MNNTLDIYHHEYKASNNYQPSQYILDNWQIQIAKEIICQWQKQSGTNNFSSFESIDSINQQIKQEFVNLFEIMKLNIQEKTELGELSEFILHDDEELLIIFEQFAQNLEKIIQESESKNINVIEKLFSVYLQEASPQKMKTLFENLRKQLVAEKRKFDAYKDIYLGYHATAWQAYFIFNQKLYKFDQNSSTYQFIIESMWRAICICFELKFKIKFIEDYSQMVRNLINLCDTYYDLASSSCQILDQIETSLNEKSSSALQITSLPAFMFFSNDDVWQQKHSVETWVGHTINYWGRASISWQDIESILLKNIETIILDNYQKLGKILVEYKI
jgi:hypothetical protein